MSFEGELRVFRQLQIIENNALQFGSWTYTEDLLALELLESEVQFEEEVNDRGESHNISVVVDGIGEFNYLLCFCYAFLVRPA